MEGIKVGPINGIEHDIEFLFKDADCPLLWMPYTVGDPLPFGSVFGGHLADGSATYVVKEVIPNSVAFGYYSSKSALAYYASGGVHTTTSMDISVLIRSHSLDYFDTTIQYKYLINISIAFNVIHDVGNML